MYFTYIDSGTVLYAGRTYAYHTYLPDVYVVIRRRQLDEVRREYIRTEIDLILFDPRRVGFSTSNTF